MSATQLHPPPERCCPICGADLEGHRPDALVCGSSCRRERNRLLRLLAGESDGPYRSVAEYLNRRQKACQAPPKIDSQSRTDRAGQFVDGCCAERPGHVTIAQAIYAAYLGWCEAHEPDAPLSRSAFEAVVDLRAPIEGRVSVPHGGRGRPRRAYRGLALMTPSAPAEAA